MYHEAVHVFLQIEEFKNPDTFNVNYPDITGANISGQMKFTLHHSTYASLLNKLSQAIWSFNP